MLLSCLIHSEGGFVQKPAENESFVPSIASKVITYMDEDYGPNDHQHHQLPAYNEIIVSHLFFNHHATSQL